MNIRLRLGPPFFSIAMVFFGVQYLRYGHYAGGLPPVPPWAPGGAVGAYIAGVILIVGGLSILLGKKPRCGATMIGIFFLLCVVILHGPRLHGILYSGTDRTRAFEPLALSGAAFALISLLPTDRDGSPHANHSSDWITPMGRWLFALSMIVFGIQHFMYAEFIATLVTSWIPAHLFWVYFTGVGMIVVGLAVITGILGQLAATWLGIMFLLWVLVLHAPRVTAALHNGDEWNSMVVALAFSGASFVVARTLRGNTSTA
jgi:uncharacterized membrane protein YphA (DoxX/SURF4 family)